MAGPPVVCQTCGTTWVSNLIDVGSGSSATFVNVSIGPCPTCGGIGRVPDGTYTVQKAVRALRKQSPEDLALIRLILERTRRGEIPESEAADAIQEAVPGAAGLLGSKSQTLGTWIGVLIGIIAIILAVRASGGDTTIINQNIGELNVSEGDMPPLDAEEVRQIVEEVLRQEEAEPTATSLGQAPDQYVVAAAATPVTSAKVPRNSPCPCGSGKKYKRCHAAAETP